MTSLLPSKQSASSRRRHDDACAVDPARVALMLCELRLPTIERALARVRRALGQGGLARRALPGRLAEHEVAERARRRIERHLAEAQLAEPTRRSPAFDFADMPMLSQGPHHGARHRRRLAQDRAPTCCSSARPAAERATSAPPSAYALIENGWRVLFTRTTDLVQRLQAARRELALEGPSPSSTTTTC